MKLFKYTNFVMDIEPQALALEPFKKIWNRDKSKDKHVAQQVLAYIYFMEDPRSDYQYIIDPDERSREIIKGEGMPKDWKPDTEVKEAMDFYATFKPSSYLILEDARLLALKVREEAKKIDFGEIEEVEKRLAAMKNANMVIEQMSKVIMKLDEAEKNIAKELTQSEKARGSQEKHMYEDM